MGIFLAPSIILFTLISVFPILYGFWMSFTTGDLGATDLSWAGLYNYGELLHDETFWASLRRGALYAFVSVVVQTVFGVAIALAINESFKFANIVRTVVLLPYLVPTVAVALIFNWILSYDYGLLNYMLLSTGFIQEPINFFSVDLAMVTVIAASSWKFVIFVVLIVLARLQSIDPDYYEVAKLNGANVYQRFIDVTLPNLKSVLFLIILLRSIWMFNKFDMIYLLTGGGPLGATQIPVIYAHDLAFGSLDFGMAAAVTSIMFVLLATSTGIYIHFFSPEEEVNV
mgnify:CR=1 FL=1